MQGRIHGADPGILKGGESSGNWGGGGGGVQPLTRDNLYWEKNLLQNGGPDPLDLFLRESSD